MRRVLLIGSSPDVLEAKRVVLEGAGYTVHALERGASARTTAEQLEASLIVIDVATGSPDARSALDELCSGNAPSGIPVLVIGDETTLQEFEGPGCAIRKPAEKRALLESTRTLLQSTPRTWTRRKPRPA